MDDEEIFDSFEQELIWLIGYCGGVNKLGAALGFNPSVISRWLRRHRKPTPQQAMAIEAFTQGKIKRESIRPDIYAPVMLIKGDTDMNGFEKKPFKSLDK